MSAKVITTPATRASWVREGRMRRVYHDPLSASTSRFGGTWPARTVPASASRVVSLMRRGQSAGGRPVSVGMTRDRGLAAGREERMLSLLVRQKGATPYLARTV